VKHLPKLVHFYGAIVSKRMLIVLERMDISLDSVVRNREKLTQEQMECIALDVAIAMYWIHENRMMNRDLSSKNILVTFTPIRFSFFQISANRMSARLIDFGTCTSDKYEKFTMNMGYALPITALNTQNCRLHCP
jgi:serine/threonine protein kinase